MKIPWKKGVLDELYGGSEAADRAAASLIALYLSGQSDPEQIPEVLSDPLNVATGRIRTPKHKPWSIEPTSATRNLERFGPGESYIGYHGVRRSSEPFPARDIKPDPKGYGAMGSGIYVTDEPKYAEYFGGIRNLIHALISPGRELPNKLHDSDKRRIAHQLAARAALKRGAGRTTDPKEVRLDRNVMNEDFQRRHQALFAPGPVRPFGGYFDLLVASMGSHIDLNRALKHSGYVSKYSPNDLTSGIQHALMTPRSVKEPTYIRGGPRNPKVSQPVTSPPKTYKGTQAFTPHNVKKQERAIRGGSR